MTVKLRRVGSEPEDDGGGDSGSQSYVRCDRCSSEVTTIYRPARLLVVDVRGRMCADCNPERPPVHDECAETDAVADQVVKIWWAGSNTGQSRWRVLYPSGAHGAGEFGTERALEPAADPPAGGVHRRWVERFGKQLEARLGEEDWRAVAEAWQPGYCEVVAALGNVIDDVRTGLAGAGHQRLMISLVGLTPVVAAVLSRAAIGSLKSDGLRLDDMPGLLRALGPTVCVGVGSGQRCSAVRRDLGDLSADPNAVTLAGTSAPRVIRALGAGSGVAGIAELIRPAQPAHARREPVDGRSDLPAGGAARAEALLRGRHTSPSTPARFGTP